MVAEAAQEIVLGMSALASSLSLASSMKNLMTKKNISAEVALEELKKVATPDEVILMSDPAIVTDALQITIIDYDLLDVLEKKAELCRQTQIDALGAAQRRQDEIKVNNAARACMCGVLEDIKDFNGGKLPDEGSYNRWWISFGCT